jgi:fatty-acid desaturase
MGEGWHNNHHFYASAANQGWFWWELDVSYLVLRGLAAVRVVWDLRTPPAHVRAGLLPPQRLQEDRSAGGEVGVEHAL